MPAVGEQDRMGFLMPCDSGIYHLAVNSLVVLWIDADGEGERSRDEGEGTFTWGFENCECV